MQMMHWNYFFALEDDLATLSRYVEFHKDNFKTFSVETVRILMTAVQEIDVLLKAVCNHYGAAAANIGSYCDLMTSKYPTILEAQVALAHHSIVRTPFASWTQTDPPSWRSANNKVKHARDTNFSSASLENAIDAVSALLIVNFYRHEIVEGEKHFELVRMPRLFNIDCFVTSWGGSGQIFYGIDRVHEYVERQSR